MRWSAWKLASALTVAGTMLLAPGLAAAATGTWTYAAGPINVEGGTQYNIGFFNFSGSTQTISYEILGTQPETGSFPINDGAAAGQSYTCMAVGSCSVSIIVTLATSDVSPRLRFVPDDATEEEVIPPGGFLVNGPAGSATNAVADIQTELSAMQTAVAALATQVTELTAALAAARTEAGLPYRQCKRKGDGTLVCKSKNVFVRDQQQ